MNKIESQQHKIMKTKIAYTHTHTHARYQTNKQTSKQTTKHALSSNQVHTTTTRKSVLTILQQQPTPARKQNKTPKHSILQSYIQKTSKHSNTEHRPQLNQ